MRIALFHNYYQLRGGEDQVFELEVQALRKLGHEVFPFTARNEDSLRHASPLDTLRLAWNAPHNPASHASIADFLRRHRIEIGHVHNWFPVISPAVYAAHKELGIPVVQTLHNYRLGCANGTFRRHGEACTACLDGHRSRAALRRCYRQSALGSLAWMRLMDQGWSKGIFADSVDAYICPSSEVAAVHAQMGLPKEKLRLIPNACEDSFHQAELPAAEPRNGGAFLGRLVQEKGADTLIDAWRDIDLPLRIIGDGPERAALQARAAAHKSIQFLGQRPHAEVSGLIQATGFLVFPSRWAEPFGLGIIEAMAAGRPIIATRMGAPSEIVQHEVTGLLVPPDDPQALKAAIEHLRDHPQKAAQMGQAARKTYLERYRPEAHAHSLTRLYQSLIAKPQPEQTQPSLQTPAR